MKNRIYTIVIVLSSLLIFNSCNGNDDENMNQSLNGIYTGTFTVKYLNGDTFSNPVSIDFTENNNYLSSGNVDRFPAGGSGTYKRNGSRIEFNDANIWTADFDWYLILRGEYDYSFNGNELIISANRNSIDFKGFYKYELSKE